MDLNDVMAAADALIRNTFPGAVVTDAKLGGNGLYFTVDGKPLCLSFSQTIENGRAGRPYKFYEVTTTTKPFPPADEPASETQND